MSHASSEAAVSFVLHWTSPGDIDSTRTTAHTPSGPCDGDPDRTALADMRSNSSKLVVGAAFMTQEGADDLAREEQEGREALMRLGIFLENNAVHEDTVDALSSMGWL